MTEKRRKMPLKSKDYDSSISSNSSGTDKNTKVYHPSKSSRYPESQKKMDSGKVIIGRGRKRWETPDPNQVIVGRESASESVSDHVDQASVEHKDLQDFKQGPAAGLVHQSGEPTGRQAEVHQDAVIKSKDRRRPPLRVYTKNPLTGYLEPVPMASTSSDRQEQWLEQLQSGPSTSRTVEEAICRSNLGYESDTEGEEESSSSYRHSRKKPFQTFKRTVNPEDIIKACGGCGKLQQVKVVYVPQFVLIPHDHTADRRPMGDVTGEIPEYKEESRHTSASEAVWTSGSEAQISHTEQPQQLADILDQSERTIEKSEQEEYVEVDIATNRNKSPSSQRSSSRVSTVDMAEAHSPKTTQQPHGTFDNPPFIEIQQMATEERKPRCYAESYEIWLEELLAQAEQQSEASSPTKSIYNSDESVYYTCSDDSFDD